MPRNKQQGDECGECEGSWGIGLMPSINIGPAMGCGSCSSGLECIKEDGNKKLGKCQFSHFSQPPGSFEYCLCLIILFLSKPCVQRNYKNYKFTSRVHWQPICLQKW